MIFYNNNINFYILGLGITAIKTSLILKQLGYNTVNIIEKKIEVSHNCNIILFKEISPFLPYLSKNNIPIIISPGIPPNNYMIKSFLYHNIRLISDINIPFMINPSLRKIPCIGITGTNGKSTVVSLIKNICQEYGYKTSLIGNIGIPAITVLEFNNPDVIIIELSSFQLYWLSQSKNYIEFYISSILNITEDHLNWHTHYQEYINCKNFIYSISYIQCINKDIQNNILNKNKKQYIYTINKPSKFELGIDNNIIIDNFSLSKNNKYKELFELPTKTNTFTENYLISTLITYLLKIPIQNIYQGIISFTPLKYRCEKHIIKDQIFINDSKSTNPDSVLKSLSSISNNVIWITGGISKNCDFSTIIKNFKNKIKYIILYGKDKYILYNQFIKQKYDKCYIINVMNKNDVLYHAITLAIKLNNNKKNTILFSPGCASFDIFNDYKERGNIFNKTIQKINNLNA